MKILFLTLYPDIAASPRYRVSQFLPYLRAHGVECTVACPLTVHEFERLTGPKRRQRPFWYHLRETVRRVGQILDARGYDIVFVQKAIMTAYVRGLPEMLRKRAHRLVYDIDDAVHLDPPHPLFAPWNLFEDRNQIYKIFSQADLVLAGNRWLASIAQEACANTVLFPTVVDTDRFVPAPQPPDTYRLGWVGNPSTTICLAPAVEALAKVRAAVCLVGGDPARISWNGPPAPDLEVRAWTLDNEVAELHRFAVGLMPQPDAKWMLGKCALKALQYMACGIPCVASPVGAARDLIRRDENGLLAASTAEWLDAFNRLRDPALRKRLGEAGRATVEKDYSMHNAAPKMLDLLRALCDTAPAADGMG